MTRIIFRAQGEKVEWFFKQIEDINYVHVQNFHF